MRKNKERRNGFGSARSALNAAVVFAVAATVSNGLSQAAVTTAWTNTSGGNFNTPGNWSMGVPGSTDTAQFNILNNYTVTLDINPSITSMSVGGSNVTFANSVSNRTFSISSALNVNSGSLTLNAATPVAFAVSNNTGFNTAVNVNNGNTMSVLNLSVGVAGNSTTTFDGTNTSLTVSGGTSLGFGGGKIGTLTFSNHATGNIGSLNMSTFSNGTSNLNVQSGASVNAGNTDIATNAIAGTTGSLTVTGAGTIFSQNGGTVSVGASSASMATMTVSTNASAMLTGGLNIVSTGELDILSGGTVSESGPVALVSGSGSRGNIQISAAGSAMTITGGVSPLTVGNASGNPVALILNGGTCTTSSSTTTINKTGLITITSGAMNLNSDLLVDGGSLLRPINSGTALTWASGKTMTIQNGGTVSITGNFNPPTSATINVTGTSSSLTTGTCTLANSDQINITSGGQFAPANLKVTSNPSGVTIGISGSGSSYSSTSTLLNSGAFNYNGGTVSAGNLTLSGTGQLLMSPGHDKALVLSGLTINGSGNLDLSDNSIIVNYAASDTTHATRDTIRNLLINGRNGAPGQPGNWNGVGGISSSFAHTNGNGFNLAIGYGDNEDIALVRGSGSYTSFGGQTVFSNTVLVQMTRGADATLDGVVDAQDVTILGSHFNKPNSGQWVFGDFDYSGTCDATDVTTLGSTFGKTTPTLSPAQMTAEFGAAFTQAFEGGQAGAVPEPASLTLLGLGSVMVAASRRRNRRRQRRGR